MSALLLSPILKESFGRCLVCRKGNMRSQNVIPLVKMAGSLLSKFITRFYQHFVFSKCRKKSLM